MTYRGEIHNGGVVLNETVPLPEGSKVACVVIPFSPNAGGGATGESVFADLMEFAGAVKGAPPDGARRHDDYLYRTLGI